MGSYSRRRADLPRQMRGTAPRRDRPFYQPGPRQPFFRAPLERPEEEERDDEEGREDEDPLALGAL